MTANTEWGSNTLSFKSKHTNIVNDKIAISDGINTFFSVDNDYDSSGENHVITLSANKNFLFETPKLKFLSLKTLDVSDQDMGLLIKSNTTDAMIISDGETNMFQITTHSN